MSNQIIPISFSVSWRTHWALLCPCLPPWPVRPRLAVLGVGDMGSGSSRPERTGESPLASGSFEWLWPTSLSLALTPSLPPFWPPCVLPGSSPSISSLDACLFMPDLTFSFPAFSLAFLLPSPSHFSVGAVAWPCPHQPCWLLSHLPCSWTPLLASLFPLSPRPWGGPIGFLIKSFLCCQTCWPCAPPFPPATPHPAPRQEPPPTPGSSFLWVFALVPFTWKAMCLPNSLPDWERSPLSGLSQLSSL